MNSNTVSYRCRIATFLCQLFGWWCWARGSPLVCDILLHPYGCCKLHGASSASSIDHWTTSRRASPWSSWIIVFVVFLALGLRLPGLERTCDKITHDLISVTSDNTCRDNAKSENKYTALMIHTETAIQIKFINDTHLLPRPLTEYRVLSVSTQVLVATWCRLQ